MKWLNRIPEPLTLVLIAAPALFLLLPDGIPFVYAGCVSNSSLAATCSMNSINNSKTMTCGPITSKETEARPWPGGKCGLWVATTLQISAGYGDCEVCWRVSCDHGASWCNSCDGFKAENGKGYDTNVFCDSCGDKPYVELHVANDKCGDCQQGGIVAIGFGYCSSN